MFAYNIINSNGSLMVNYSRYNSFLVDDRYECVCGGIEHVSCVASLP